MLTLTVTAKGQVTLKKELLNHLGVKPGQQIEVEALADGRVLVQAAREGGDIQEAFGVLAKKNKKNINLLLDEIAEISRSGWDKAK